MRRPRKKVLTALVLPLSLLAAEPAAAATSCGYGHDRAGQTTQKKLRLATLCLLNRERRQHGLPRLSVDPSLRRAARWHARDMVERRYFAHVSLGGSQPADRMRAAGYMGRARSWYVGENLVWGAGPFSTPVDRVRALMQSPPHRANMLGSRYREVGVWVARRAPVSAAYRSGATYVLNFGVAG